MSQSGLPLGGVYIPLHRSDYLTRMNEDERAEVVASYRALGRYRNRSFLMPRGVGHERDNRL